MKKLQKKTKKVLCTMVGTIVLSTALLTSCGNVKLEVENTNKTTEQAKPKGNMNDFDAKTLNGSNFTNEDLKKYDLTMVNIWYTGCKPCVDKMPETEELYKNLPENVNLVSLCVDGNENNELASRIVKESKVTYPALIPDDKLMNSLVKDVSVFPTTVFVDKDGNIVGDVMEGAPASDYSKMYLDEINNRLEMLKK